MKVRSSETRSLSGEFEISSSKAQVPSSEAQRFEAGNAYLLRFPVRQH
ncbi:hypothetical protein [Nostoc sp.]